MVMPFSRSRSFESITRSSTCWLDRNAPACHSIASTSVVLPWSTWATIATLRMSLRVGMPVASLSWIVREDHALVRAGGRHCPGVPVEEVHLLWYGAGRGPDDRGGR